MDSMKVLLLSTEYCIGGACRGCVKCHNDSQMSLDYHLVDPLGDDEKDEQQSDVLDGC